MAKLVFGGVHLLDEVDRLGGYEGKAYANTSYFRAYDKGERVYDIELETSHGLVTVRHKNGPSIIVPRERVKRFEPMPEFKAEGSPANK